MLCDRRIFVCLVHLSNILCYVRAQCPSVCICTDTEVNCTDAALTEFPSCKFGPYVREVNFSHNNITSLGVYTIRRWMIISVRHLNISNNALRTLNEESFMAQSGLEVIDLSGNELEYIAEKTFMYIPKLTWLSLANNKKLKMADGVPFLSSDSLQVLHLEECGLYKISLSAFNGLSSLRELYLLYNKITTVEMGAGTSGRPALNIRYLELSHNNLQVVPHDLTELQSLEYLGMRHNELRNLSDILLVEGHVKRLNVSDNKWECLCVDCSVKNICENISCQVDVCESPSEKDLFHCFTGNVTTAVNEPLRQYAVSVTGPLRQYAVSVREPLRQYTVSVTGPLRQYAVSVTEPLRQYAVSVTEPHAPQHNATTTTPQYLLVIAFILIAVLAVLTLVNVCLTLHERGRKSRSIDPEQSLPLTVVTSNADSEIP